MRVLVCGSRDYTNRLLITERLCALQDDGYDTLIEGEARGADIIAKQAGEALGMIILPFPANWDKYGKRAGYIRNQQMLDEGHPDLVVAFYTGPTKSRGTQMMVSLASNAGVPIIKYMDREAK